LAPLNQSQVDKPVTVKLIFDCGADPFFVEFPDAYSAIAFYQDVIDIHGDFITISTENNLPVLINKNHLIMALEESLTNANITGNQ
jgi:hypothetical protein